MIVQLLGALIIAWILVTVTIGVWSIYRSAKETHAEEAYDRFLEAHEALAEYLVTTPHDTEYIYELSADVIRYAETGHAVQWLAETLLGFELEDLVVDELERKWRMR